MKIFTAQQVRTWDQATIEQEPIASINLMERASEAVVKWLVDQDWWSEIRNVAVVCGPGNNGGDGFAVARLLKDIGIQVKVYAQNSLGSEDRAVNKERYCEQSEVYSFQELGSNAHDLCIDALFGTGLTRPLEGEWVEVVDAINKVGGKVLSIDIPSGLPSDVLTEPVPVVQADFTCSFQVPKPIFFDPVCHRAIGEWHILNIGLLPEYYHKQLNPDHWVAPADVAAMLPKKERFAHKGINGHAVIIGGSEGMVGAVLMAAESALFSGVGLLSLHLPESGRVMAQTRVPEAMVLPNTEEEQKVVASFPELPAKCNALGIGPGLGRGVGQERMLKSAIQTSGVPMVLDADALNILSENKTWFDFLPPKTILTPHLGEFERLAGKAEGFIQQTQMLREFCQRYNLVVVLKGGYTRIGLPNGTIWYNTNGNPGMATGGMGDVLTGVITSLLAQGLSPDRAAICGVHLHACAGDITAEKVGDAGVTASQVAQTIGLAIDKIHDIT